MSGARHTTTALITSKFAIRTSARPRQPRRAYPASLPPLSPPHHPPRLVPRAAPSYPPHRRPISTSAPNMSSPSGAAPSPNPSPAPSTEPPTPSPPTPTLPPLTPAEFKEYNRLAEHMDLFHNHFRSTWNTLYTSASSGRRAQGLSIRAFINTGLEFVSYLETHHGIEEKYIFPVLARRMPEFRTGRERPWDLDPPSALPTPPTAINAETKSNTDTDEEKEKVEKEKKKEEEEKGKKKAAELLRQHVEIHAGMDGLSAYLRGCLSGETELQMSALKAQLDTWGAVLWAHLDQEVRVLGADNMRRYWSLDEVRRIRM
ncbi:hypothetical protein F4825DRAFT_431229 [Nemania diffusa]|nr:hypothetical protein F4825DRAFT_431229 [Nemania diffusa]